MGFSTVDTFTPAPAAGYIAELPDGTRRPVIGWIWDGYDARPYTDRGRGRLLGFDIEYALELLTVPPSELAKAVDAAERTYEQLFGGDQ
jgi:hypothetical protein